MAPSPRRLSRLVGRVPSAVFGLGYLVAIPLFAVCYSLLPGHFYHSTAQYDPEARGLQARAESLAVNMFDDWFKFAQSDPAGQPILATPGIHLAALRASITPNSDIAASIYTTRYATWLTIPRDSRRTSFINARVDIVCGGFPSMSIDQVQELSAESSTMTKGLPMTRSDRRLLADVLAALPKASAHFERTPQSTLNTLARWMLAQRGFGGYTAANFSRALYLSSVTITTLGIGDIVPITDLARTLVAIEAVIGVVLVGLFLNSLARESSNDASVRPQA